MHRFVEIARYSQERLVNMPEENLLPVKILHDFAERIENLGIKYLLTGSMAMMNYSVYRFTADIDLILELKTEDVPKLIKALEPNYYVPHQTARRAVSTEKMFNVIHEETAFKIDCAVRKSTAFQMKVFQRGEQTNFYGRKIWIITKEDLILSKLWWAKDSLSEKQLTDVKNLIRTGFDGGYIKQWTRQLGVDEMFEQCLREIGE
jgi:hypothetical protein